MPETEAKDKGPYLCALFDEDGNYQGSCGIEHETKADATEHQKALKAEGSGVFETASVADIEASREGD